MIDSAMTMTGYAAMQYLCAGVERQRCGNLNMEAAPAGMFRAQDKLFVINCGTTKMFQQLYRAIGRPDIADDPALQQAKDRVAQRERIESIAQQAFVLQPWAHWRTLLGEFGIPAGEVRALGEALLAPEVTDRGLVSRIPHPDVGWLPNLALPFRLERTPMADPTPAPALGEHTDAVLGELLGLDGDAIAGLRQRGAFGPAAAAS